MEHLHSKIIIRNYTDLSDLEILSYISTVVNEGKISTMHGIKTYCLLTTFKNGYVVCVEPRVNNLTTFYFYKQ